MYKIKHNRQRIAYVDSASLAASNAVDSSHTTAPLSLRA